MSATFDDTKMRNAFLDIDCLICHSSNYPGVQKAGDRVVVPTSETEYNPVNARVYYLDELDARYGTPALNTALANVYGKPKSQSCALCHNFSAGGPAFKRGFWAQEDVHYGKVLCVDCHTPLAENKHEFSIGPMPDLFTNGNPAKQCTDCHTGTIHENQVLNDHTKRIDCRTCHIPENIGLRYKDFWDRMQNSNGNWDAKQWARNSKRGASFAAYNEAAGLPTYLFKANAYQEEHRHGIKPGKDTAVNTPKNANARLMIFNDMTIKTISNAAGQTLPLKVGVLAKTNNVGSAVYNGIYDWKSANKVFALYDTYMGTLNESDYLSGNNIVPSVKTSYFQMDHRIRPAAEALKCVDCHTASGKVASATKKWRSTGYSSARSKLLIFSQK